MKTHLQIFEQKANLLHSEIASIIAFHKQHNQPVPTLHPILNLLNRMYSDEFELAKLLDQSDIVLHAEGTSVHNENPRLDILTWLFDLANKQFQNLIQNTLSIDNLSYKDSLNIELTGLAHGSIYAGFKVAEQQLEPMLFANDNAQTSAILDGLHNLTSVPKFIGKTGISPDITERIPDAWQRDIALMAALNFSPSGRNGVHTIEMFSPQEPDSERATLNLETRVVLREVAVKKPVMTATTKHGTFIGDLREIDLDKRRITIRNVSEQKFSVRCAFSNAHVQTAKEALASERKVKVTGKYEEDKSGKPRMMSIETIEPAEMLI